MKGKRKMEKGKRKREKGKVRKQYNEIADIYDLLSEGDDGGLYFRLYLEKVLKTLPKESIVLDSSCGTGDHAIWLTRQGYRVYASDISDGMIACAKEKADKDKLNIDFFRSSWEELTKKTKERFDLVIIPGNSLSHLENNDMMKNSFNNIRKVVKPGACFCFDLRNWEKTFEENSMPKQDFRVKGKDGVFNVRYSYEINGWNTLCRMFVDIRRANEEEYKQYVFDFFPIGYLQIHDALLEAGFESIEKQDYPDDDYYFAVAN